MDRTITKVCLCCGNEFTIPQCRDWREKCCSSECKVQHRQNKTAQLKAERTRQCAHCNDDFVVKKSQLVAGHGKYCSHRCATDAGAHAALFTEEAMRKSADGYRKAILEGRVKRYYGEENVRWKGGRAAFYERNRERLAEKRRQYRKENPHKVREFTARRKKRKYGRLKQGTVKKLFELQKGRCVICRVKLKTYHLDHIMPLAKGGLHVETNVQLLCPDCNIRKAAKDPISYMQSRGFLL